VQFLLFGHQPSHDALPERVLLDNKDDHDSSSQQQTLTLFSADTVVKRLLICNEADALSTARRGFAVLPDPLYCTKHTVS